MLVLARRTNQKIRIGEDIVITVLSISGDNVRLGIEAPPSVPVFRSEIYEDIQQQNNEALAGPQLSQAFKQLLKDFQAKDNKSDL